MSVHLQSPLQGVRGGGVYARHLVSVLWLESLCLLVVELCISSRICVEKDETNDNRSYFRCSPKFSQMDLVHISMFWTILHKSIYFHSAQFSS